MWQNPLYLRLKRSISDLLLVYGSMPTVFQLKKYDIESEILNATLGNGLAAQQFNGETIVVSLTTHKPRLHFVHLAIASIMRQTIKANRIVLWLDNDIADDDIPEFLRLLTRHGLEIRRCEDIRSYKKLVPAIKAFPDDIIITIDDDVIYDPDTLERLLKAHKKYPDCIIGNRCAKISRNAQGCRKSYSKWENPTSDPEPSFDILPIGVEGILYPPHSLHPDVTDSTTFMKLCPTADDLWFKAMGKLNNTRSCLSQSRRMQTRQITGIPEATFTSLYHQNISGAHRNDTQLDAIESYYGIKF